MKEHSHKWVAGLEKFAESWWYPALVAGLAAADAFIFIVPIEVLLVPAVLAHRKRWVLTAFWITLGSALGAAVLAYLVTVYGSEFILHFFPGLMHERAWQDSLDYLHRHGVLGLGIISLSPFPQHAAVVIAGLAQMNIFKVFFAVLVGRFIKYEFLAWAVVHAPWVLEKFHILPKTKIKKP